MRTLEKRTWIFTKVIHF